MRRPLRRIVGICSVCLSAASVAASPPATTQPQTTQPAPGQLARLVHEYFQRDSTTQRREIVTQIEGLEGVTVQQVAAAIRNAALWEPRAGGRDTFTFPTATGDTRLVNTWVPPGYDPAKSYPLIVALHWARDGGGGFLDFVLNLLGEAKAEFLVAAPHQYRGTRFNARQTASAEPVDLLRELRRRYHVDTDRVYLIGYSMGGHAACTLATLHTHWFAGAVSLSGTLVTPHPVQMREILLPNISRLPMILAWGEEDVGRGTRGPFGGGIAGSNRNIRECAKRLSLPIQGFELAGFGHHGVTPPADALHALLRKPRAIDASEVSHWFRYPCQGRMDWLRQVEFRGMPWTAPHLAIRAAPDGDHDAYVTQTLKGKLAYIGGAITGQRIGVTTVNTAQVEIRLHDGLVDLNQPILLHLNGKKRLHAIVKPKISTLLELAHEDWEFQHLYPVRLTVGEKGMARQR